MIRPLETSPRRPLAAAAIALALAACILPAHAQFDGTAGNDLTAVGNGGSGNANGGGNGSTSDRTRDDEEDDADGTGTGTGNAERGSASTAGTGTTALRAAKGTRGPRLGYGQPEPRDQYGRRLPPYVPSEFELYVQRQAALSLPALQPVGGGATDDVGRPLQQRIQRFGASLVTDPVVTTAWLDPLPTVPGAYVVRPGDEVDVSIWGTANAELRLVVDRAGRIAIPQVGTIAVAGLRNDELEPAIRKRVSQLFKNYQLSAAIGQVRPIRVFVGGYALRPGSITLGGLSSVLHAVMRAGGPSAAGSFREIHLRRAGHEVAVFDLYDLMLKGDHATDQLVQPDDVIFIGPVGPQVAVLGSVNQQAIFETKPGETLTDVLQMAGGFDAVADRRHVAVERLEDRATGHVTDLKLPQHAGDVLATGDVVRVFSAITASVPTEFQNERVRVEGEVLHPGDYVLPPGSKISDALRAAGGMTRGAYPYATEFTRESVRQAQEINYQRALNDLETDMVKNQASERATSAEEINAKSNSATANQHLLDRLRQIHPTGRVVLKVAPEAAALPDLALEDGDVIKIPPRNSSVGVFGSVFTTGSFVYEPGHTTEDYLALAGGPTRGADKGSVFMIRANGSVISARQGASFWHSGSAFSEAIVQPGDTLFVPEQVDKSTFVQDAKDWTQILYQFGLGLAGIKSLGL
ncbi:MAG: SLBB domain-containing protein [Burkholderiaceae bacterium]